MYGDLILLLFLLFLIFILVSIFFKLLELEKLKAEAEFKKNIVKNFLLYILKITGNKVDKEVEETIDIGLSNPFAQFTAPFVFIGVFLEILKKGVEESKKSGN